MGLDIFLLLSINLLALSPYRQTLSPPLQPRLMGKKAASVTSMPLYKSDSGDQSMALAVSVQEGTGFCSAEISQTSCEIPALKPIRTISPLLHEVLITDPSSFLHQEYSKIFWIVIDERLNITDAKL